MCWWVWFLILKKKKIVNKTFVSILSTEWKRIHNRSLLRMWLDCVQACGQTDRII